MGRWHGSGHASLGGFSWDGTPRRRMEAKKRLEAEERNAATPHERTRAHRLEMEAALQRLASAPATKKKRSKKS